MTKKLTTFVLCILSLNLFCRCSAPAPMWDELLESFAGKPVKEFRLEQKPLVELHGGMNLWPRFSPNGERLAYLQKETINGASRKSVFIMNLVNGKKELQLDQDSMAKLGVDVAKQPLHLGWIDDRYLYIENLPGKRGQIMTPIRKVYDVQEGQFVDWDNIRRKAEKTEARQEQKPLPPLLSSESAQIIIEKRLDYIDRRWLTEYLKRTPAILDPYRLMVVQLPTATGGSTVWFIDLEKKKMHPLIQFSEKYKRAQFLGGDFVRGNMVLWIFDGAKTYLFSYKERTLKDLAKFEGKLALEEYVYDDKSKSYSMLAFTIDSPFSDSVNHSLFFFDGTHLSRAALSVTPCGLDIDSKFRNVALSVCGPDRRDIIIQPLGLVDPQTM